MKLFKSLLWATVIALVFVLVANAQEQIVDQNILFHCETEEQIRAFAESPPKQHGDKIPDGYVWEDSRNVLIEPFDKIYYAPANLIVTIAKATRTDGSVVYTARGDYAEGDST